jgi:hypothetical protein
VTTSEQVAWQMLAELGDRDRRLVEAWQQLGNDLTTSLLNSRVLSRTGRRWHPNDQERIDLLLAHGNQPSPLTECCEHEASHAITATVLGHLVEDIEVNEDGGGETTYQKPADPADIAVIACTPEVWFTTYAIASIPAGYPMAAARTDARCCARPTASAPAKRPPRPGESWPITPTE